jgi:transposase
MNINQFIEDQQWGQYLTEFQRQLLQKQLAIETTPEYQQRIEIMLLADEGQTQSQICRVLACSPLTARHWIFMAKSGQAHNWQAQPIGRPKTVTDDYLDRLRELLKICPKELGYPFSRWTGQWLSKHLCQEFNIEVSARHINRLSKYLCQEFSTDINLCQLEQIDQSIDDIRRRPDQGDGEDPPAAQKIRSRHLVIADLHDYHTLIE